MKEGQHDNSATQPDCSDQIQDCAAIGWPSRPVRNGREHESTDCGAGKTKQHLVGVPVGSRNCAGRPDFGMEIDCQPQDHVGWCVQPGQQKEWPESAFEKCQPACGEVCLGCHSCN